MMCGQTDAKIERLKEDYAAITEARCLLDTIGGIAYQAMLAGDGGVYGQNVGEFLEKLGSPWTPANLQENTYQVILKLAGDAWRLLNECADPENLLKETAPEPQAAAPGGE